MLLILKFQDIELNRRHAYNAVCNLKGCPCMYLLLDRFLALSSYDSKSSGLSSSKDLKNEIQTESGLHLYSACLLLLLLLLLLLIIIKIAIMIIFSSMYLGTRKPCSCKGSKQLPLNTSSRQEATLALIWGRVHGPPDNCRTNIQ